jgi:hypothetical protein
MPNMPKVDMPDMVNQCWCYENHNLMKQFQADMLASLFGGDSGKKKKAVGAPVKKTR